MTTTMNDDTGCTVHDMESGSLSVKRHRFPCCIVWTPIPLITWLFPFVGHMGICTSVGVIRDFAGSYYVSEDDLGFGWPTRYLPMSLECVAGGSLAWDKAVNEASCEYQKRMHNLFCDNCHSHVAMALNLMNYKGRRSYNMIVLTALMLFKGRFTGIGGFLKQWLPFLVIVVIITAIATSVRVAT